MSLASIYDPKSGSYIFPNISISASPSKGNEIASINEAINYTSVEMYSDPTIGVIKTAPTPYSSILFNGAIDASGNIQIPASKISDTYNRLSKIEMRIRVVNTLDTFNMKLMAFNPVTQYQEQIGEVLQYDPSNNSTQPDTFNYLEVKAFNVNVEEECVVFLEVESASTGTIVFYPEYAWSETTMTQIMGESNYRFNKVQYIFDTEIFDMSGNSGAIAQNTADIEYLQQNVIFKDGNQTINGSLGLSGNLDAGNAYINGDVEVTSAEGTGKISSGDGAFFIESSVANGLINFSKLDEASPAVSIQTDPTNMSMTCNGVATFEKQINVSQNVNCEGALNCYGTAPYLVLTSTDTEGNKTTIETSNAGTRIVSNTDVHFTDVSYNDKVIIYHDDTTAMKLTGELDMDSQKILNVADPVSATEAVNKVYCDNKLLKSGDTMSGVLNMSSNRITNVGTPSANSDVATKAYVDNHSGMGSNVVVIKKEWTPLSNYTGNQGIYTFTGNEIDFGANGNWIISVTLTPVSAFDKNSYSGNLTLFLNSHPLAGVPSQSSVYQQQINVMGEMAVQVSAPANIEILANATGDFDTPIYNVIIKLTPISNLINA